MLKISFFVNFIVDNSLIDLFISAYDYTRPKTLYLLCSAPSPTIIYADNNSRIDYTRILPSCQSTLFFLRKIFLFPKK